MGSFACEPASTVSNDFTVYPSGTAHAVVTDADDGTYITTGARSKVVLYSMTTGATGSVYRVTDVSLTLRANGTNITEPPAVVVKLILNGVVLSTYTGTADTSGAWQNLAVSFAGLNILPETWDAGTPQIQIETLGNGNRGSLDPIPEEV